MEKDTIATKADFLYQCQPPNPVSPPKSTLLMMPWVTAWFLAHWPLQSRIMRNNSLPRPKGLERAVPPTTRVIYQIRGRRHPFFLERISSASWCTSPRGPRPDILAVKRPIPVPAYSGSLCTAEPSEYLNTQKCTSSPLRARWLLGSMFSFFLPLTVTLNRLRINCLRLNTQEIILRPRHFVLKAVSLLCL